jgi:hypothetical protein
MAETVFRRPPLAKHFSGSVAGLSGVVSRPGEGLHELVAGLEGPAVDEAAKTARMPDADLMMRSGLKPM